MGGKSAKDDLQNYRDGYPNLEDDRKINDNYLFYSGQMKSRPDGDFIDHILKNWWGNTSLLEEHHGYIQWLFPIREHGMNSLSEPLQLHEIEKIKQEPKCLERFIKSYQLMLDFYGVKIADLATGKLERNEKWKQQYRNLNNHSHNNLRITRILKCLGEFGYEHYKIMFLEHFITEIFENNLLSTCRRSCANYWIGTVKDNATRKEFKAKIKRLAPELFESSDYNRYNKDKIEKARIKEKEADNEKHQSDKNKLSDQQQVENQKEVEYGKNQKSDQEDEKVGHVYDKENQEDEKESQQRHEEKERGNQEDELRHEVHRNEENQEDMN